MQRRIVKTPSGTRSNSAFDYMFPWELPAKIEHPENANVPTGTFHPVLHTNSILHNHFVVVFKMRSALCCRSSLDSSTTYYGTRYRCCQSEGRRGQDYDRNQPGGLIRGSRSQHAVDRLRSTVECIERPGAGEGSRSNLALPLTTR